jgi:CRISPR/Cas system-associated exonuclease Cas4 (RecB family)
MSADNKNNDKLDNLVWSFSKVNNYNRCPHGFKLTYIDKVPQIDNAFAEYGSFAHSLLEKYFKGEVEFFELSQMYENEYNINVLHEFPSCEFCDLTEKYYNDGLKYFNSFDGLEDNYKTIGVEQEIRLDIDGEPFIGYIDLILQDIIDGRYIIIDHKSKSKFKSKKEKEHFLLQLYLYSLYVKEQYGEYPKELKFNMFRTQKWETELFSEEKLKKSISWFTFNIDMIYSDNVFPKNKDDFFCNNLCGVREICKKECE